MDILNPFGVLVLEVTDFANAKFGLRPVHNMPVRIFDRQFQLVKGVFAHPIRPPQPGTEHSIFQHHLVGAGFKGNFFFYFKSAVIKPDSADFTTDLHSLGQFIQEGSRNLFETVIRAEKAREEVKIGPQDDNLDGLNFLAGKTMHEINEKAFLGTLLAHTDGGVPNLVVTVPEISPYWFGQLVYFFEKACGISGYLMGVNPFDQPGGEAYKKNMFALLEKPGYEKEKDDLAKRLAGLK